MSKRILFINACARSASRTHALCAAYIARHFAADTVTELNLYSLPLSPLDETGLSLRNADAEAGDFSSPRYNLAKQFAAADAILVGAPYWDCSFPAVLKLYVEQISVCGLTFCYTQDGRPQGLCRASSLVYVTTAGGYIGPKNTAERYLADLCDLYGIPSFSAISAEGLDIQGNDADAILSSVVSRI